MTPKDRKILHFAAYFVFIAAVILALPAFHIALGLPPEGDAADYRVPLIQWMIRHHSYPNWNWTMVDDYPMLGELLMLPFYVVKPGLMRLIPLLAYLGCAWVGGLLGAELVSEKEKKEKALFVVLASAWLLGLRPMTLEANLLMVDNLASFFVLASLLFILMKKNFSAGLLLAGALATRYHTWPASISLFGAAFYCAEGGFFRRISSVIQYAIIGAIGALPFLLRNAILNHNPFFPLFASFFNHITIPNPYFAYGRGHDFFSFLLLPYDMLYTNTYKSGFFDYTLGKLFVLQLLAAVFGVGYLWIRKGFPLALAKRKNARALVLFFFLYLLAWFATAQQMRFLVPALVVLNIFMFFFCYRALPPKAMSLLILASILSIFSIQKDSILMAIGKRESDLVALGTRAKKCLARIPEGEAIGIPTRSGVLGFLDRDFVFLPTHEYAVPLPENQVPHPSYAVSFTPVPGYASLSVSEPCLYRISGYASDSHE